MKRIILFVLIFKVTFGFSQIEKYYGGCGNEYAKDIVLTKDGFNIIGLSNSFDWGYGDIYDIMLDSLGSTKWAKTYRISQHDENPREIINWNSNLNIILAGGDGWYNSYLMATDSLGVQLWTKESQKYRLRYLIKSKSNELIACGDFQMYGGGFPPAILTLDSLGNLISSKYFPFSPKDPILQEGFYTTKIIQDKDSNFVITGRASIEHPGTNYSAVFVIKLNKYKNLIWSKVFNYGALGVTTLINSSDNSYIISGNNIFQNAFVMKLDTIGNLVFLKEFSFKTNVVDLIETTTNSYLLLTEDSKLTKLDKQAQIIWNYQYDSSYYYIKAAKVLEFKNNYYLLKTSNTNPISTTYSPQSYNSDMLIIKIDSLGNSNFKQVIPIISSISINTNTLNYSFIAKDSTVAFNSIALAEHTVSSTFSNSLDCIGVGIKTEQRNVTFNIFPNPNTGTFKIELSDNPKDEVKIEINDVFGSLVQSIEVRDKKNIEINLPENQKGIFIVKIFQNNYLNVFKVNCF